MCDKDIDTDDTETLCLPQHLHLHLLHTDTDTESGRQGPRTTHRGRGANKISRVDTLVQQVNTLQLSLERLEKLERLDTVYSSEDHKYSQKELSHDPYDLYSSSDCSTVSILSITSTLNMDRGAARGEDVNLLTEIDSFLHNINNMDIHTDPDHSSYMDMSSTNKTTPHKTVKKDLSTSKDNFVDATKLRSTSPTDYIAKYSKWNDNDNSTAEANCPKVTVTGEGYLKNSVPDYGFGMRDIMYAGEQTNIEGPLSQKTVKQISSEFASSIMPGSHKTEEIPLKRSTSDTLQSIQNSKQLCSGNSRKKLDMNPSNIPSESKISEQSKSSFPNLTSTPSARFKEKFPSNIDVITDGPPKFLDDLVNTPSTISDFHSVRRLEDRNFYDNSNYHVENMQPQSLPSLSMLWSTTDLVPQNSVTDLQKYEEEKIRREHCEQKIQELQRSVLEQQQKLAIALQVDAAKDGIIRKLKTAVTTMSRKVGHDEEKYHQQLNKINFSLKAKQLENEEMKKKLDSDNGDIVKAHKHVQETQLRCEALCSEKEEVIRKLLGDIENNNSILKNKDDLCHELKESNILVVQLNKQISESVAMKRAEIEKLTVDNEKLKKETEDFKKSIEGCNDEISVMKNDKNELSLKISEERARNAHLEAQKTKQQVLLDAGNMKSKSLEMELQSVKQQMESQKEALKIHYQKQVENILTTKVEEFKKQLNAAESLLDHELQSREKEIATQFAKQLQKIEHQHQTEISILEEKHKEEIKLYRLQLAQCSQMIDQLESNLNAYKNKRGQIAAQLHHVLENQWKQTLKIITNAQGDSSSASISGDSHQPTSNSHNYADLKCVNNMKATKQPEEDKSKFSNEDNLERKSCDKLLTKSSNSDVKSSSLTEEDIQNYVKLLLQKMPGVTDLLAAVGDDNKRHSIGKHHSFEDEYPTSEKSRKAGKHSKKPWK